MQFKQEKKIIVGLVIGRMKDSIEVEDGKKKRLKEEDSIAYFDFHLWTQKQRFKRAF